MIVKTAIIVSTQDPAGLNIKQNLTGLGFKESKEDFEGHKICVLPGTDARLYTTDTESIHCENIDRKITEKGFDAELFIFATKHKAESGIKSFSVHVPGNWGRAELGGKDRKLCVAPASYLKAALLKLDELVEAAKKLYSPTRQPPPASNALVEFDVIQECTHHGPYLEKPCMFIEIGSSAAEWSNKEAGRMIAETIIHLIKNKPKQCKAIFGIGGLHHTPEFSKIARRTEYAVGHVCPKYNAGNLDEEMIRQALDRNSEKEAEVVLDWKGLKEGKERIVEILTKLNIRYKRTKELI